MKKLLLDIISSLIIIVLILLGIKLYDEQLNNTNISNYALFSYDIKLNDYTYIGSVINDTFVYLLYNNNNDYLLKEINIINQDENIYTYNISSTCQLQNNNNYPFITCTNNNEINLFDVHFNSLITQEVNSNYNYAINTSNDDSSFIIIDNDNSYEYIYGNYQKVETIPLNLEHPIIKDAYCQEDCLLIRFNELTETMSLYRSNQLLESNVKEYQLYNNGIYTYDNTKIRIYNGKNNEYKEFNSPIINLLDKSFALGKNDYYLYILNDQMVNIYNLYNEENITNINIDKINGAVNKMVVINNYLYIITENYLYVYDITSIENSNLTDAFDYENELIYKKIAYYQDNYNVTINIEDNPNNLSENYDISSVLNINDIINALSELDRYFIVFNYDFFTRFTEFAKGGLEIYLAESITSKNGDHFGTADVVGLYINSNNKYNIVICINSGENINTIAYHETLHAIEDYLSINNITFSEWNNLNPTNFTYTDVYYTNQTFTDTLNNNKFKEAIYFVDNYARSNELEDRARMFEYICQGEYFTDYPHLNAKVNYIKQILLTYFPELYNSSYFNL